MLEKIKRALRITASVYDAELMELAKAGADDLRLAGVTFVGGVDFDEFDGRVNDNTTVTDALTVRAIITYVRLHFGTPSDYDRLKASYDEQKAQLMSATNHTEWE